MTSFNCVLEVKHELTLILDISLYTQCTFYESQTLLSSLSFIEVFGKLRIYFIDLSNTNKTGIINFSIAYIKKRLISNNCFSSELEIYTNEIRRLAPYKKKSK